MARITVEDCEKVVENRFELVVLAAQRTRQILAGDTPTLENNKDGKKTVLALREVGAMTVAIDSLRESCIKSFRSFTVDEEVEDTPEAMEAEDTYNPYLGIEIKSLEPTQNTDESESPQEE